MNKKTFVTVVLTLLLAFVLPATVGAATSYKFKGQTVYANYYGYDPSGCIWTDIFISGYESVYQLQDAPDPHAGAFVAIYKYDYCNETYLVLSDGFTILDPSDFGIKGKLKSAQLNTTVPVTDYFTGSSFNVDINLSWAGFGDITSNKGGTTYQTGHCKYRTTGASSQRLAEISGTVSADGTDLTSGLERYASLNKSASSEMTINCDN